MTWVMLTWATVTYLLPKAKEVASRRGSPHPATDRRFLLVLLARLVRIASRAVTDVVNAGPSDGGSWLTWNAIEVLGLRNPA